MAVGQASGRRGDPGQVLTLATWGTGQHPEHSSSHQAPLGATLQGPCGRSPKRRGSLRYLPPLEVRPSSVAPDPAALTSCVRVPPAPSSDSRDGALGRRRLWYLYTPLEPWGKQKH